LKEFKRLGLYLRDRGGRLIRRMTRNSIRRGGAAANWGCRSRFTWPIRRRSGDRTTPRTSAGTSSRITRRGGLATRRKYPPFQDLLDALDRVIARHAGTQFVCVHFANNAEDLDWVEAALDQRPNMFADLAARIPEIGRHDPARVRRLFLKHQDRILFERIFRSMTG